MRCHEMFAGERCRFRGEHHIHASKDDRVVWGADTSEYRDGFTSDIPPADDDGDEDDDDDEDDQVLLIDSAQQYDEPFPHVLVEKRVVFRSCPYCAGTGIAYDPMTGEGPKCPHCQRRNLPS